LGVGVLPARIGVGEEVADVGQRGGAEEGVAEGVGERVGVGVAVEAEVAGEGDAAEHERAARDSAVDVVAVADAEGDHARGRIRGSEGHHETPECHEREAGKRGEVEMAGQGADHRGCTNGPHP